jgi:hypothetical protein
MYLFNCSSGLEFLHTKCKLLHGDISINNIMIYRFPLPHPPPKDCDGQLPLACAASASVATEQAVFTSAPPEGVTDDFSVSGIVINYDYACKIGTTTEKTLVHARHS